VKRGIKNDHKVNQAGEEGICSDYAKDLPAMVRLRNLLSHHRYWVIDGEQVLNSIKDNFGGVDKFIESVQEKYASV
jgi:uncharacterized protein YutE (UPF0331/DUF86 family)